MNTPHAARRRAAFLGVLLGIGTAAPAPAEGAEDGLAATPSAPLEEVEVLGTAPGYTVRVDQEAATHYHLDRATLDRANVRSLDEALRLVPGVNVRVGGDGTPRVDMRGLRTRQVKLILNGVPVNSAVDGNFDPTLIPADYIEAIDVLPGAVSQLYGDGALAGAIAISTRRGEGAPEISTRAEFGELGAQRLVGTYAQGFSLGSAQGDVFVSLGRRSREAFPLSSDFLPTANEGGGARQNSDLTRNTLYSAANFRLTDALEVGFAFNGYLGERGIPTSIYNDRDDTFAQRPRFERAEDEHGWYVQASVNWDNGGPITSHSYGYVTTDLARTARYEDERYAPTTDASVRNTYEDVSRGRIVGGQSVLRWDTGIGTLSMMLGARRESFESDCVIQDLPVVDGAVTGTAGSAQSYQLDFALTTTNDTGATDAGGGNNPVARLIASNRPGGGIDFSLTNIAGTNYGADSYLKYLYLSPGPGFDLATLTFSQALNSEGDIGNVNIRADQIDGYDYSLRVNLRRPEQGDALFDNETARFIFNQGDVNDFFSTPISLAGQPDVFGAVTFRRTDPVGFFGNAEIQNSGGVPADAFNVNVQALSAVAGNVAGGSFVPDPTIGGSVVDVRLCSAAGGGGGGLGLGGNRVERIPALTFTTRTLTQDRSQRVYSSALEFSVNPTARTSLLASAGLYHNVRDDGVTDSAPGFGVAGYWDVRHWLRLRAAWAQKVRVPTIAQLYDPDRGNPDLAFERNDSTEVGADLTLGALSLAVSAYRQDVTDFIQTDPITERLQNIAALRIEGLELLGRWTPGPRTTVTLGYTLTETDDRSPGTTRSEQQYTPRHRIVAQLDQTLSPDWRLHVATRVVADQLHYARTVAPVSRRLGDFWVTDMNVRYQRAGVGPTLILGADNLLDRDYEESYGLPQAGRFLYAGLVLPLR